MNSPEIKDKINHIKARIEKLIENGNLDEAKNALEECDEKIPGDPDICSMFAIIKIIEGSLDEAESILLKGLQEDSVQYDLLYNLAYIREQRGLYLQAADLYSRAATVADTDERKRNVDDSLEKLRAIEPGLETSEKARIVFFVKKGMDSFLGDIINGLSEQYWVRKIIVSDFKQIDTGMEWADICWFEWCDELVAYGSRLPLAQQKKLVCRLHSYEAFSEQIGNVLWEKIDKVIFVAKHIKSFVLDKQCNLRSEQTIVIPNGIDISSYTYKDRGAGFNVAYVGYINYKKGPMLLLHTFKALYDKDKRYKLYIAGKFQDYRDELYYNQMIREFGIENNVFYEGWRSDINQWLEDKNYILCTSVLESQNISVMQAMCKGIKPVVHNFVGARGIYSDEYIWNTVDEAVESIKNGQYESEKYREFIKKGYSIGIQINKIKGEINKIIKINKNNSIISFLYKNSDVKFYLPNLKDYIQYIVFTSRSFYELSMLENIKQMGTKGSVIVDIGANIGNHTIFFSKICEAEKVYSFEPQKDIFDILKKNVEINNVADRVTTFNMALGDKVGKGNIVQAQILNSGMASINVSQNGNISIDTLDHVLLNKVDTIDIIKIDVEGMEINVIQGATRILREFKPLIYIEAATDEEFNALCSVLSEYNYRPISKFNATPTYLFKPYEL